MTVAFKLSATTAGIGLAALIFGRHLPAADLAWQIFVFVTIFVIGAVVGRVWR
jgi:membrane protein implicated in regulation of membrane protease activity